MPNGRLGDHPLTDILHHGCVVFGTEIDSLVREIANMPGYDGVREHIGDLLYENWPYWGNVTPGYDAVRRELMAILAELSHSA